MAQHDGVIDNGPGLTVRTDMNAVLQAILSQNSGPIEPTTKYPGMIWLDTTVAPDGQIRMRNQANTAWVDPTFSMNASFTTADIGFGARTTPNRFVWNDKADLTGTDIMRLDDTGQLTVMSSATPTLTLTGPTAPQVLFNDGTRSRGQVYQDLAANELTASIWNAAGTLLRTGEIFDTGNSPASKSATGYQKLASGVIFNWGTVVANAGGDANVTFPAAFPSAIAAIAATENTGTGVGASSAYIASVCNLAVGAALYRRVLSQRDQ